MSGAERRLLNHRTRETDMPVRDTLASLIAPLPTILPIATSGGIDSSSLTLAAKDAGKEPIILSFTLADRESSDFVAGRKLAEHFGFQFVPVILPVDDVSICDDVIRIIRRFGARRKTAIECLWPYLYVMKTLKSLNHSVLLTGNSADGHFGLSRKAMVLYDVRASKGRFQRFRQHFYANPESSQIGFLHRIYSSENISIHTPWFDPAMFKLFEDCTWEDVNKPRQKEAVRVEFPELDVLNIAGYGPLQLGDSGIAETVGAAVRRQFSPESRSPVSAYNFIAKGSS